MIFLEIFIFCSIFLPAFCQAGQEHYNAGNALSKSADKNNPQNVNNNVGSIENSKFEVWYDPNKKSKQFELVQSQERPLDTVPSGGGYDTQQSNAYPQGSQGQHQSQGQNYQGQGQPLVPAGNGGNAIPGQYGHSPFSPGNGLASQNGAGQISRNQQQYSNNVNNQNQWDQAQGSVQNYGQDSNNGYNQGQGQGVGNSYKPGFQANPLQQNSEQMYPQQRVNYEKEPSQRNGYREVIPINNGDNSHDGPQRYQQPEGREFKYQVPEAREYNFDRNNRNYVEDDRDRGYEGNRDHKAIPIGGYDFQGRSNGRVSMDMKDVESDCMKMVRDPGEKMNYDMMYSSCQTYRNWGEMMYQPVDWKPNGRIMNWWDGLSMHPQSSAQHNPHRRHKRQAGFSGGRGRQASVRKEYRMMTSQERQAFHDALNVLKNKVMGGYSMYDIFVINHQPSEAPGAHFGPAFYGWHREMLFRFENALKEIDPSVSLPFWDSNLDNHLGDQARNSILWTPEFLGNEDGYVTTGPFANWVMPFQSLGHDRLFRSVQSGLPSSSRARPSLMTDEALATILEARSLREITWAVDSSFEAYHGGVHNFIGGIMTDLANSPNDPAFFLHHTFIDCLWEGMRLRQSNHLDVRSDYPNDTMALGVGMRRPDGIIPQRAQDSFHYSLNPMRPFTGLRNIDGLSTEYSEYYTCASRPSCSRRSPDCGSLYLFCDRQAYRCAPKLRHGANCERFAASSPCYNGVCCRGTCQQSCDNGFNNQNFRPQNGGQFQQSDTQGQRGNFGPNNNQPVHQNRNFPNQQINQQSVPARNSFQQQPTNGIHNNQARPNNNFNVQQSRGQFQNNNNLNARELPFSPQINQPQKRAPGHQPGRQNNLARSNFNIPNANNKMNVGPGQFGGNQNFNVRQQGNQGQINQNPNQGQFHGNSRFRSQNAGINQHGAPNSNINQNQMNANNNFQRNIGTRNQGQFGGQLNGGQNRNGLVQPRSGAAHMNPILPSQSPVQGQMQGQNNRPVQNQMRQQQGQMPFMQGQRPQIQGQMPQMQGQRPPVQGQRPQMQGQRPPMQGQRPPMQGQRPPMQGQMTQTQGQRPQMLGQSSNLQGQRQLMQGQNQGQHFQRQGQIPQNSVSRNNMQRMQGPMAQRQNQMQGPGPLRQNQMQGPLPQRQGPGQLPQMQGQMHNMQQPVPQMQRPVQQRQGQMLSVQGQPPQRQQQGQVNNIPIQQGPIQGGNRMTQNQFSFQNQPINQRAIQPQVNANMAQGGMPKQGAPFPQQNQGMMMSPQLAAPPPPINAPPPPQPPSGEVNPFDQAKNYMNQQKRLQSLSQNVAGPNMEAAQMQLLRELNLTPEEMKKLNSPPPAQKPPQSQG